MDALEEIKLRREAEREVRSGRIVAKEELEGGLETVWLGMGCRCGRTLAMEPAVVAQKCAGCEGVVHHGFG